jgi:hypothetical protein
MSFCCMTLEIWQSIPGFPGYQVSDQGQVARGSKARRLSLVSGGMAVQLAVARLVGAAFCPDYAPELRVIYKDGNCANCAADNLQWVPRSFVTGIPYSKTPRKKPVC